METELGPLNIGLASALRKADIHEDWRRIVDTATLQRSMLWKKEKKVFGAVTSGCAKEVQITRSPVNSTLRKNQHSIFASRMPFLPFAQRTKQQSQCHNAEGVLRVF